MYGIKSILPNFFNYFFTLNAGANIINQKITQTRKPIKDCQNVRAIPPLKTWVKKAKQRTAIIINTFCFILTNLKVFVLTLSLNLLPLGF